jgi:glycerol-3-phosphate dehydrogenase
MTTQESFDLVIIGGGINGAGIARDAAGRGLKVALCEQNDLASATSSASSKLIHGGLRYLEQYAFRLVSEALTEREVLLSLAPHLVYPATFVLPYIKQLRPAWMLRLGLVLYDTLGRRSTLHRSQSVDLRRSIFGSGLKPEFRKGFIYSDCTVDDSRLVVLNAFSAAQFGAKIFTRAKCVAAKTIGEQWQITVEQNRLSFNLRARTD